MFFMLSKRIEENHWLQIGIVIEADVERAAKKIGREIDETYKSGSGAFLKSDEEEDYTLEHFEEISGPV